MDDEDDEIAHFFVCNDHDALLFITAKVRLPSRDNRGFRTGS